MGGELTLQVFALNAQEVLQCLMRTCASPSVQRVLVKMAQIIALSARMACILTKVSVLQLVQVDGELELLPTMLALNAQGAPRILIITGARLVVHQGMVQMVPTIALPAPGAPTLTIVSVLRIVQVVGRLLLIPTMRVSNAQ